MLNGDFYLNNFFYASKILSTLPTTGQSLFYVVWQQINSNWEELPHVETLHKYCVILDRVLKATGWVPHHAKKVEEDRNLPLTGAKCVQKHLTKIFKGH